jgi:predicted acylesterase/phospholipase RssA
MKKIGLALSGGGFRASLYHLGLVRFLRDAGILSQVSHITSVSGGSILGAHLVLHWDRYNGSANEFDAVASEFLSFVGMDVRNRITRRFPLTLPFRWPRRLLGYSNRKLTRTGLLEYHYQRYLYGDVSLFELPVKPQLHILATNLSEGCLCSFNRNGLLMVHRQPGQAYRIDPVHAGLATVAMAVTASSAFPGFFPPLEVTGADVGTTTGEFGRQAYTDGGVFDNLGVRMFGCLSRSLLSEEPLCRDDFFDFDAVAGALQQAGWSSEPTPLRRLAEIMVNGSARPDAVTLNHPGNGSDHPPPVPATGQANGRAIGQEWFVNALWEVMRQYQLNREPLFACLKLVDSDAEAFLHTNRAHSQSLGAVDQLWLNRHLLEAAFRQATGQPCFRRLDSGLDGVLVSDVGKKMEVKTNERAGGLVRTALRATDIVMDRVWQLEIDMFQDTPGFVFAPITDIVEPEEDPTALHPEIQRQLANIRTDLDRFSPLETSTLIRHGYCIGRKVCRTSPDLFGTNLPANAPWDPIPTARIIAPAIRALANLTGQAKAPAPATVEARTLQRSAFRRIWSTLLDYRDWVSYIYVPIIVPILFLTPYMIAGYLAQSHQNSMLMNSLSQNSWDYKKMSQLLAKSPTPWKGEAPEKVRTLDEPNLKGFEILQDSRMIDLRAFKSSSSRQGDPNALAYVYHRMKVVKLRENTNNTFRATLLQTSPQTAVRFPAQTLKPTLRMTDLGTTASGEEECRWEVSYDFQRVPPGEYIDLLMEKHSPGMYLHGANDSFSLSFPIDAETAELTMWILMPKGKAYDNFRIVRHPKGKPSEIEKVRMVTEYLPDDFTIIAFKLLTLKPGFTYEVAWIYK